jgi:hypothetical protein
MQYTILRLSLVSLHFAIQDSGVLAQTSSASRLFPVSDGMIINYIDTIVLQWRSNYANPWMQMWCQNGSNDVLGESYPHTVASLEASSQAHANFSAQQEVTSKYNHQGALAMCSNSTTHKYLTPSPVIHSSQQPRMEVGWTIRWE